MHNHNLEEKAIAQSRLLHQQLEESEQHYRTTIQREAETFANNLQQELQYHMTSNAQSQSLLSAERDKFRKEYDVQAKKWNHYSEEITHQAEETLQGLTDEYNELGEELAMAQLHLLQWEEWQQEGFPPQTQAEEDGMGPEEIKEFFASLNQDEPQASPLTPAVQQDVLSSRHLPPTTLPSFGTRVPGNLSSDSSTHLRSAKASRTDRDTDLRAELQEVIQQNRVLEENQTALLRGAAPTSPQPMSHGLPNSGLMSPLTIHQPFPSMPTGDTRGPWSTTRDRIQQQQQQQQQQQLQHHPGTTIPSGVPGSEPSFGPLSGGASAGVPSISPTSVTGMAYPAVAVAQPPMVSPTEMPKDDFKREKLSLSLSFR